MFEADSRSDVSVLLPSAYRPDTLRRCLQALAYQSVAPREVVVVLRADDNASWAVVNDTRWEGLGLLPVQASGVGVVGAMNVGLALISGRITAITDDDARPRTDWIARISAAYEDPTILGYGGKDVLPAQDTPLAAEVGVLRPWGRWIGNHSNGSGSARPVAALKGVNSSYKTTVLKEHAFDTRLRGDGAQVHWELSLGLTLSRRSSDCLRYDPDLVVDHDEAPRHDGHRYDRPATALKAISDASHNETLVLVEDSIAAGKPIQALVRIAYSTLVGTRNSPGVAQALRFLPTLGLSSFGRLGAALAGKWSALAALCGR